MIQIDQFFAVADVENWLIFLTYVFMSTFDIRSIKITPSDFNEVISSSDYFEQEIHGIHFYPIWEYRGNTTYEDNISVNVFIPMFLSHDLSSIKWHLIDELKIEMKAQYDLFHMRNNLWSFGYNAAYVQVHSIELNEWYKAYGQWDGINIKATVKVSFGSAQR